LLITGGVDDIWVTPSNELIIVDYKATSKKDRVSLDADWQIGYKRQMDIYSWLFRQNGFKVYDTGYFVYCNGDANLPEFGDVLKFETILLPYKVDDTWVESEIGNISECLRADTLPATGQDCDFCAYVAGRKSHEG
jgi:RecB family exonuclease